jgi:hypothetical protein
VDLGIYENPQANPITVGAAAAQGANLSGKAILFQSAPANTGVIYLGNSTLSLPNTGVMFSLAPGEKLLIGIQNFNDLWHQSNVAAQTLFVTILE